MHALEIINLSKQYQNGVTALNGINLTVAQGDFFALLGPNGAGKTTTIGILTSLVTKTSGTVKIFGVDIDQDFATAKSYLGVVPQEFNFGIFEKIIDIVVGQAGFYGLTRKEAFPKAEYYLNKLGLWHKRNHISRSLSGGMKRRLMIARALVHEPKMLILDEPTAGVDVELRRHTLNFLQELNSLGTTIILTTHYLEEAERLCRGIAIIDKGAIITNTTVNALLSATAFDTYMLELAAELKTLPAIPDCSVKQLSANTIEINMPKHLSLNYLFTALIKQNITVVKFTNKVHKLEDLFINLVTKSLA